MKFRAMYPQNLIAKAKSEYVHNWKGLTPAMVARGISKLRESDSEWPPEPREFADRYCKLQREDLGLPSTHQAWIEACSHAQDSSRHEWTHSAIRAAGQKVNWSTIAGFSHDERVKQQFEYEYEARVNQYLAGQTPHENINQGIEDQSSKSILESAMTHNDQQQRDEIQQQGIDPDDSEMARQRLADLFKP